jgi:integrase
MKLTVREIRAVKLPRGAIDKVYFDERLPGFGLRFRASGVHSWMIQYMIGKRTRRVVLGLLSGLDPSKAYNMAKDILAQVRLGRDPATERAQARIKAAETFSALLPRFLDRQQVKQKPSSYKETKRYLSNHAKPLHGLPVESVERRTIASLLGELEKLSGAVAANRARAALSAYFNWLAREGYIDTNPVSFTNKAIEAGARVRTPNEDELRTILRALRDDEYGAIVRLLILTGLRRDEIGSLCWSEVDLDAATITLPPARTKNGREHTTPLSEPALEVLKARARRAWPGGELRDYVFGRGLGGFSGWSKSKVEFDTRIAQMRGGQAFPHWTLHDLRRTISTALHERFGVAPHVVEVILGHVSGHKGGVAGVYNKALYIDERRRALERWGKHVMTLVNSEPTSSQNGCSPVFAVMLPTPQER